MPSRGKISTLWPVFALVASAASAQQLTPPPGWGGGYTGGSCTIRPLQTVDVVAQVTGVVAQVKVVPGQVVSTGDVIAVFDSDVATADLAVAQARADDRSAIDLAQTRHDGLAQRVARLERAHARRAISTSDLEAARLELDIATGELAQARNRHDLAQLEADRVRIALGKTTILSPVDGQITADLIDPGESPGIDQPIATIIVTDPLRVEVFVPTSELRAFTAQDTHHAMIQGERYALEYDYTSVVADYSSSTVSVFFKLRADDVLPGFDCRIISTP